MKLSAEARKRAITFINREGRPLERAICEHLFAGGARDRVLQELVKFQNPDGGFGNGLEPDLRSAESSVLCTSVALEILADLNIGCDEPMLKGAISFLMNTYDEERHVWRIIPQTAESSPHAPWWNRTGLEKTFGNFLTNPRARICGYLFHYRQLTPEKFRTELLARVLEHMEGEEDKIPGDSLLCYISLSQCDNLPTDSSARLNQKIMQMIPASVETDSTKWEDYCLKPIWTITSPHSPYHHLIAEAIDRNLDYEIQHQEKDGSWKPFWNWAGAYPEDWLIAEREWRGKITLDMLRVIAAFGRIEK
ncbi:prenyltransferase/squalene oxidase repeat-containing protein [Desulfotalea psychrophila]|uniref:Uncharacterized protein n=1 Tax=Desulfotalea psychrophila (strain LSv54 / DSM 12343) TaxID=177439 RepID=Q6AQN6_DESPS|nr:hypothetical protein [Desulfotalea psychrophila]CAG35337.1 conserved hypothetical protein [Desulfotalea psychrophila LSv54]